MRSGSIQVGARSNVTVRRRLLAGAMLFLLGTGLLGLSAGGPLVQATSQNSEVDVPRRVTSLKSVSIPVPPNLSDFVRDRAAAVALGKAFFWDQQMGSDGMTACATCHYQAGADVRSKNTISPGVMGGSLSWYGKGPNYQLTPGDFPFHRLFDEEDAFSPVLADTNDVAGAQGVFDATFNLPGVPGTLTKGVDSCTQASDGVFSINGINTRRVTGRNAPSAINAAFNFRNFWDGRANNNFNGVNPFGDRDPNAVIYKRLPGFTTPQPVHISIPYSSLASQAVGPPGSAFEMSCGGRIFPNMGRKLLTSVPLGQQLVDPTDSVLGAYASSRLKAGAKGLTTTYVDLIRKAFKPEYWDSTALITIGSSSPVSRSMLTSDLIKIIAPNRVIPLDANQQLRDQVTIPTNQYLQMEANFSLFWGLAVQLYEDTLIANDSPVDRFFDGKWKLTSPATPPLTPEQLNGMAIFHNEGRCIRCHGGPETTNASIAKVTGDRIERMRMGDGGVAVYDDGFYNIGVRPTSEDHGIGGKDPFGNPLSEVGLCQRQLLAGQTCDPAVLNIVGRSNGFIYGGPLDSYERIAIDGNFKAPGLRNVELTGPYFHNGSQATLDEVIDFYNRGGDFADANFSDLDPEIEPLGLSQTQKDDLVSFLVALTDERVRWERAPFDHPALCLPAGHPGTTTSVSPDPNHKGPPAQATDTTICLPAVGAGGRTAAQGPLKPFLGLDPHTGAAPYTGPALKAGTQTGAFSQEAAFDPHGTTGVLFSPPPAPGSAAAAHLVSFGQTSPAGMVVIDGDVWVSDHVLGFCRLDPLPTGSLASSAVNPETCDPNAIVGSPGQPTYDPTPNPDGTHYLYVPDNSRKTAGVWRLTYDPRTRKLSRDPVTARSAALMVPGAGLAGVRATATTLGPDGMLYIGALKSANIWRIDNPRDDPRVQTMNVIARTTDGRGVKGSIAFVGSDLYLPEARALTVIYNAPACWAFGCGPTRLDLPGVAAADSVASDGHVVYVASLPPAVAAGVRGGAGVLAPETIWRYDPATNPPAATVFETSGNLPAGLSAAAQEDCFRGTDPSTVYCRRPVDPWALRQNPTALFFVLGMYFDSGSNALYIGDDPLAGKRFGTGHIWVVK